MGALSDALLVAILGALFGGALLAKRMAEFVGSETKGAGLARTSCCWPLSPGLPAASAGPPALVSLSSPYSLSSRSPGPGTPPPTIQSAVSRMNCRECSLISSSSSRGSFQAKDIGGTLQPNALQGLLGVGVEASAASTVHEDEQGPSLARGHDIVEAQGQLQLKFVQLAGRGHEDAVLLRPPTQLIRGGSEVHVPDVPTGHQP